MAKVKGRDRLRFVLTKLPKEVRLALRTAILSAADDMVAMQKRLAPVQTGKLRDSITATPGDRDPPRYAQLRSKRQFPDPYLAAIVSAGNSEVRYSALVEFGTAPHLNEGRYPGTLNPGTPPRPFFYPGYRASKKRAQAKINRAARIGIRNGIK